MFFAKSIDVMAWFLAYQTSGNHLVNPFPIDFEFPTRPIILKASPIGQINLFRKMGRLIFLSNIPEIGISRGSSQLIFRGSQEVNCAQLTTGPHKAEFYLYGYVPELQIQIWQSN